MSFRTRNLRPHLVEINTDPACVWIWHSKKSWSDAKFCSQSDAVSFKRAPELSSQWTGSTWTDSSTATSVPLRGYINTTPDKYPLYLSFFFSLFPRLFFHLPITIGGATDHRWSVIRTDQSPRFGTHVIRGLTDKFNRVKVYHLHALRFCAQPLPRTLKRAHAEKSVRKRSMI